MNELLRSHVTRIGFALTLTKPQIAALVNLDLQLAAGRTIEQEAKEGPRVYGHPGRHLLSSSVVSEGALIARGLLVHHPPTERQRADWMTRSVRDYWSFTEAGRLVIALLKESGLWQEVAAEIPYDKPPDLETTYTAEQQERHWRGKAAADEKKIAELRDEIKRLRGEVREAKAVQSRAELDYADLRYRMREVLREVAPELLEPAERGELVTAAAP